MPFSLRSSLAEIISEAFVKMVFEDNYVHCDINLNNVLVQVRNGRTQFAFIRDSDFIRVLNGRTVHSWLLRVVLYRPMT